MKELIKWIYLLIFAVIFIAIEYYVSLGAAIVFGVGFVIKNQLDIEEKLNELDDKNKEERELWKAILPTRKRF